MHYYKVISIVLFSLFLGMMAAVSSADIYRWVDEKGQVHFGDKPVSGEYDVIEQEPSRVKPQKPETKQEPAEAKESVETDLPVVDKPKAKDKQDTAEQAEEKVEEQKVEEGKIEEEKSESGDSAVPEQVEQSAEEKAVEARQKRISDMEALTEELRLSREKRETKREKEKDELRALREGCVTAMERVSYLQAQLDHYVSLQPRRNIDRKPDEVTLDTKHQRIAAELKTRRKYVEENCDNL